MEVGQAKNVPRPKLELMPDFGRVESVERDVGLNFY